MSDSVRPHRWQPTRLPIPGILQARTLEWAAISFSNAWKWNVKVKSLSHIQLLATPWTAAYQTPPSMRFSRQEYWSGVPLPSLRTRTLKIHLIKCWPISTKGKAMQSPSLNEKWVQNHLLLKIENYGLKEFKGLRVRDLWTGSHFDHYWGLGLCPHLHNAENGLESLHIALNVHLFKSIPLEAWFKYLDLKKLTTEAFAIWLFAPRFLLLVVILISF